MTAPTRIPVDPVDHYEEQRLKAAEIVRKIKEAEAARPFILTVDEGDLCLLSLDLPVEDKQNAGLLETLRLKKRRRRKTAEKEARE